MSKVKPTNGKSANTRPEFNDFGGFDRRDGDGDLWTVFLCEDPTQSIEVRARCWFDARAKGIIHFHRDYSSVDAVLVQEK